MSFVKLHLCPHEWPYGTKPEPVPTFLRTEDIRGVITVSGTAMKRLPDARAELEMENGMRFAARESPEEAVERIMSAERQWLGSR